MGFDDDLGLEGVIARVVEKLTEKHGADWVISRGARLEGTTARAVSEASKAVTPSLVERLKSDAPGMLRNRREGRSDYREMIEEHWSEAFDLYEMVLRVGFEAGTDFGESRAEQLGQWRVFRILTRLHARGCRIAEEILVLLKNGYGQGALARWRSLHESTCVAMFIAKHGEGVAERYLLHDVIESCKATEDYEQCASRLGYEPLSRGELDDARERAGRLRDRFGGPFMSPYGWAAEVIASDPGLKNIGGFKAIEKAVELDHMRAHYRFASHPTHANAKGVFFNPDFKGDGVLAGPSPAGLGDAGHCALISLTQLTATLLKLDPGPSSVLIIGSMLQLEDEAGDALFAADQELDDRLVIETG